jgi:hypothetical protein
LYYKLKNLKILLSVTFGTLGGQRELIIAAPTIFCGILYKHANAKGPPAE